MYGLPGQTLDGALQDVRSALALAPAHLSHYQLTMEPGTVFGGRPPAGLPDDDRSLAMQEQGQAAMAAAGLRHYEVSAYARPGRQCAHNLNYWSFGDYLGLGAGAHGKLTRGDGGQVVRTVREREPRRYLARGCSAAPDPQVVPPADLPFEFMMNALRLVGGFDPAWFESRTRLSWATVALRLGQLAQRGLLQEGGAGWRPTERGLRFLNDVVAEFLPAPVNAAARKNPIGPVV